jgi:hypothetical protein
MSNAKLKKLHGRNTLIGALNHDLKKEALSARSSTHLVNDLLVLLMGYKSCSYCGKILISIHE